MCLHERSLYCMHMFVCMYGGDIVCMCVCMYGGVIRLRGSGGQNENI
jgi:hypothetical protein